LNIKRIPTTNNSSSNSKTTVFTSKLPDTKIAVGPSAPPIIPTARESDIDSEKLVIRNE